MRLRRLLTLSILKMKTGERFPRGVSVAGKLSNMIENLGNEVDALRVFIEGSIDFSDEDYDFISEGLVNERLVEIRSSLRNLIDSSLVSTKKLTKNRVLFFGPPNTGKSSLFNRMLGFESGLLFQKFLEPLET